MIKKLKKIRDKTGAGVADIKKALSEANGNEEKAIEIIRKKGLEKAGKKEGRETKEGTIGFYMHTDGKTMAYVKIYCETDFVAKNEEFQQLAKDLAMQVAALNPLSVSMEDFSQNEIEKQKEIWQQQAAEEKKPPEIAEKILKGKEEKYKKENSLLSQNFIKNEEITVGDHLKEKIAKIGENIQVGEFEKITL